MSTTPDNEAIPRAFAHSGLRNYLGADGRSARPWCPGLAFRTPEQLIVADRADIPVIVPAVNEAQAKFLEQLRTRLCLTPILAVVDDLHGHQTCRAMLGGATSVLNIELPHARQDSLLQAMLDARPAGAGPLDPAPAAAPPAEGPAGHPDPDPAAYPDLATEQRILMELLHGTDTIAAIARRFYCSERSMYRRVRCLYDSLGVSGRSELRIVAAERTVA